MENVIKELIKYRPISCSYSASFENNENEPILQHLKLLQTCEDPSVFNAGSVQSAEFYSTLHRILSDNWSDEVIQNVVAVLQVAVRNPSARSALAQTYNFIQPLSDLLDNNLPKDQKITVLNLMRELSHGAIIWQVANLSKLIGSLSDIILANEDMEAVSVSLGVLANLCHKNKPAVFTLIQCVNIKAFLKTIINLKAEHSMLPETKIQVCKLLLILDQFSGQDIPQDQELLDFVKLSLSIVLKAFTSGNSNLVGHVVDFFLVARENERTKKVIAMYSSFPAKLNQLLCELSGQEVPNNSECVSQLLTLLGEVVALDVARALPLCARITQCAARWLTVYSVAPSAIRLITAVVRWTRLRDDDVYREVISSVETNLQKLVEMLHEWVNEEANKIGLEESIVSLLQLFRALVAEPQLSSTIAGSLDEEEIKKLLSPLLLTENGQNEIQDYDQATTARYIEVLSLVSELSLEDKEWLFLYADLLQRKEIMKMFAIALFSGCFETKKQILFLAGTSSFSNDCLSELSKCLVELNELLPIVPFQQNAFDKSICYSQTRTDFSCSPNRTDVLPQLTRNQTRGVDSLVDKFNNLVQNNKLEEASLAGIIELYQYKVGEMRRAERNLRAEGARLTRRTAQLSAETARLYTLLHARQTALDGSQTVMAGLRAQIKTAHATATDTQLRFKQLNQDCQSKGIIIKNQTEEITQLKQINNEYKTKCEESEEAMARLKQISEELTKEKRELLAGNARLQENLKSKEESLKDKETLLDSNKNKIENQQQELADSRSKNEQLEKSLKEKEEKLAVQQNQLLDLERMRKLIYDITGGKKH